MKLFRILVLILTVSVLLAATAQADPASLARALQMIEETGPQPPIHLIPYPERLVELMTQNGRLAELGLTRDEGLIYAAAALRQRGIVPRSPRRPGKVTWTPPTNEARTMGEFEEQVGVLIQYPYGWSDIIDTFNQMLEALDGDPNVDVYILVNNSAMETLVQNQLSNLGFQGDNFQYFQIKTYSVWTRDYGPISIEEFPAQGETFQSMIDMKYFYAFDDEVVDQFAAELGLTSYDMPIDFEGGNYMTDGAGTCFATTALLTYNGEFSDAEMEQMALEYWGCEQLVIMQPLIGELTSHIDMYAKLLDENTVMVGEPEPGDSNYDRLEDVADAFAATENLAGEPFAVIRVPMPEKYVIYDPGYGNLNVFRSYTNSLILNDKVLVPIYNIDMDADALAVYEGFYGDKGKQVIPIDSEAIIEWLGAVHCVAMEHPAAGWSIHSDDDDTAADDDTADDDTADDDDTVGDDDTAPIDDDSPDDDDDDDDDGCGC